MTAGSRKDYINYRFHRAKETLEEAHILAEKERWNAVVNRLYYASFYAVIAVLLQNSIETQSHDGARIQFGLMFVKTGKIDKKYGRLFSKLFDYRQKGDYGDMYDHDRELAYPLLSEVKDFIDQLEVFLK